MGDGARDGDDLLEARARVGTRIDRYVVDSVLYVGSIATVHGARDEEGRRVALRVLHARLRDHEPSRATLVRAAIHGVRIRHPAFVAPRALGHEGDGGPFLVTERVDGEPLDEIVRRDGPLPLDAALAVVEEALGVMAAAHREGLVHGALRTKKLILTPDATLRVLDCGAARRPPSVLATQAPELVDEGTRGDLASAGVLLFGLLAGVRVLEVEPPREAVVRVAREAIHDSPAAHGLERALVDVIADARAFRTAQALRDAVAGIRDALVWSDALAATDVDESTAPEGEGEAEPISLRRPITIVPTPAPVSGVRSGPRLLLVLEEEDGAGVAG